MNIVKTIKWYEYITNILHFYEDIVSQGEIIQ